jgi:hypothetical protein
VINRLINGDKDLRSARAIAWFPRPALLNQVPLIVKDVFGTRMDDFI